MAERRREQCTRCIKTAALGRVLSKQMPCDHLFCNHCSTEIRQADFACPKCRPPIPVPPSTQTDTDSSYYEVPVNISEDRLLKLVCSDHNQHADFYCDTCQISVCSKCLLTTHKIRQHDIASLEDFVIRKVNESLKTLNEVQQEAATVINSIDVAKASCKRDKESLNQRVISSQKQATAALQSCCENIFDELEENFQKTTDLICSIDLQWKKAIQDAMNVQESCQNILKTSADIDAYKSDQMEYITKNVNEIKANCNQMKEVKIPTDLNLKFKEHFENMALGKLTSSRTDEDASYTMPVPLIATWILEDTIDVQTCDIDYANIVCIDEDWIVHLSNLYGSLNITIKHFSVKQKTENRQPMILEMQTYNWTVAKTAGHDRSILFASGNTVYRISFRRKNIDMKQTLKVSFDIEAITWDEYGVDCYLLAKNYRDVHWLSMNGELRFLCSLGTDINSPGSLNIYNQTTLAVLDITSREVCSRDYISNEIGRKTPLTPALPEEWKSNGNPFVPRAIALMQNPVYHFVLFCHGEYVAVGKYDQHFRFLGWIVTISAPSQENIMDIAVKGNKLFLIFETKLLIYRRPQGVSW